MNNIEQAVTSIVNDIGLNPDALAQLLAFLEITDEDKLLLTRFNEQLGPHQVALAEALQEHIQRFRFLRDHVTDPALAQRLHAAQAIYFDLLTTGDYGMEYVTSRLQIGIVQHRLGLDPKWTVGIYRKYLASLIPLMVELITDPVALQQTCNALLKVVCLDTIMAMETYVAEERQDILLIKRYAEQIIACMPSGLMIVDTHYKVRSINRAMREMVGLADGQWESVQSLVEIIDCPDLLVGIESVLNSGVDQYNLVAVQHTQRGERHIEFTISGNLRQQQHALLVMAQDVTERLRSQEELRRFRMALDSSIDAVYLIDREQLRFIDANATALAALGYSMAELTAIGPQHLKPDEGEARRINRRFDKVVNSPSKTGTIRTVHQRKDGTRFPVEVYLRAFHSEGRLLFAAIARDLTDRLNAEAELRKSEQRFRVAFNQAAVGLAHVTPKGRWLMVNQKLCQIVGYSQEEMLKMNFADITHPEDIPADIEMGRRMYAREIHELTREKRYLHKDGHYVWVNLTSSLVRDENGRPHYYSTVIEDISRHKQVEVELLHVTQYDVLTSLPNRTLLLDRLSQAITYANRSGGQVGVMLIDLDRFKNINDSLGHDVGDKIITGIARKLSSLVRDVDTVARLGGDEFVILLADVMHEDTVATLAQQVLESLAQPMVIQGHELYPAGSIGISLFPKDGGDSQTLLKNADSAMYRAKDSGRNTFQFYAQAMNARALDRLKLEGSLRNALLRDEFVLHYQPQMDLASGDIVGVEALLRWQPPGKEMIYPVDFIPIAEETGLIVAIGEWVLRTACAQHKAWHREGAFPHIKMSVNLSARQFKQQDIVKMVSRALTETGGEPGSLELEITESIVMDSPEIAAATLQKLSDMGVYLSIDDFGTGYSSLAYLKRFPIHTLKIDRSFVRDITTDPDDAAIAKAVIALAHSMKLKVIAEGVETVDQLNFLRAQGCDQIQGYYLSRPLPARKLEVLLHEFNQFNHSKASGWW